MNRLDVQTSKLQPVLMVVLAIFMLPLGFGSLISGVTRGFDAVGIGLGLAMLATFALVVWLNLRARARSVRYFSDQGLERHDGQFLPWTDLERVVYQIRARPSGTTLWRTEIWFTNGRPAWVIPMKVGNFAEVGEFVESLPCVHTEVSV